MVHCFLGISFWTAGASDLPYWFSCIFLHPAQFSCAGAWGQLLLFSTFHDAHGCNQAPFIKAELLQPEELRKFISEPQFIPRTLPRALKATLAWECTGSLQWDFSFSCYKCISELVLEHKNISVVGELQLKLPPSHSLTLLSTTGRENRMRRLMGILKTGRGWLLSWAKQTHLGENECIAS